MRPLSLFCDRDSSLAQKEHFLSQNPIKANRPPNPSLPILPAGSSFRQLLSMLHTAAEALMADARYPMHRTTLRF